MNGTTTWNVRRRREMLMSRILLVVAAIVLFSGLFAQVAVCARISRQSKEIAAVQNEIKSLTANVENLDLNINQRHNLEEIGRKAVELGMGQPDETQLRIVSLPVLNGNTSAQTVANVSGEEMMH